MVFRSATDWWLYAIIILVVVVLWIAVKQTWGLQSWVTMSAIGVAALLSLALPLWMLMATDYRVAGEQLKIPCGPFNWQIALVDIRSVTPTRSAISSPALSLDRLEIQYGQHHTILVSPEDQTGFMQAIGFDPAQITREDNK